MTIGGLAFTASKVNSYLAPEVAARADISRKPQCRCRSRHPPQSAQPKALRRKQQFQKPDRAPLQSSLGKSVRSHRMPAIVFRTQESSSPRSAPFLSSDEDRQEGPQTEIGLAGVQDPTQASWSVLGLAGV